jgi:hypothetical protein
MKEGKEGLLKRQNVEDTSEMLWQHPEQEKWNKSNYFRQREESLT